MRNFIESYRVSHSSGPQNSQLIYLGTTGVFTKIPSDRHTERDPTVNPERQESENVLIEEYEGTVLYLSGLWGGNRDPRNWVRFYKTEEAIEKRIKNRTLHLIHGEDVANGIVNGLLQNFTKGERWIISHPECYDMLEILVKHLDKDNLELLKRVIAQPNMRKYVNSPKIEELKFGKDACLQRRVDPDEFWKTFGLEPSFRFEP
ncbi:hypothetical protein BB559_001223 [Furculomyces boomerangus]|uniref:NAD-dependent epimerase/dehydratase domain-containing protein n=2 Tax=Harpellales TaxID=61421 RepID=A0A2T9Z2R7_9FUNG|nr:hypothetical protein BB559_001223 [Furculomyces boomerangus]